MDSCDPEETQEDNKNCLSDITGVISKHIGVNFGKSSGNTNDSTFPLRLAKLCNMVSGSAIFKLHSLGSGFTNHILTGELYRLE